MCFISDNLFSHSSVQIKTESFFKRALILGSIQVKYGRKFLKLFRSSKKYLTPLTLVQTGVHICAARDDVSGTARAKSTPPAVRWRPAARGDGVGTGSRAKDAK